MHYLIAALLIISCSLSRADNLEPALDQSSLLEARLSLVRGASFLRNAQDETGAWSSHTGVTAVAVMALARLPSVNDKTQAAIDRAADLIASRVQDDGTVHQAGGNQLYTASVSLMALTMLDRDADAPARQRLHTFLVNSQIPSGFDYGGNGFRYRTGTYPDLSNTHWALEALHLTAPATNPDTNRMRKLWKLAGDFITTCQVPDDRFGDEHKGGFTYYPIAADKETTPHDDQLGDTRIWGSLTYGGLKSLIYAGRTPDDLAVKNARAWLLRHFTVKQNPGLDQGGLYYHIYMLVTTHVMLGDDYLTTPDDRRINWRYALVDTLLNRQTGNGSWQNTNPLWMENDPNLCTAYAMLALELAAQ